MGTIKNAVIESTMLGWEDQLVLDFGGSASIGQQWERSQARGSDQEKGGEHMSYDTKCEELARHFLDDEPGVTEAAVKELASDVQRCVEDFLVSFHAQ